MSNESRMRRASRVGPLGPAAHPNDENSQRGTARLATFAKAALLFAAKWALAGLAFALMLLLFRPDLRHPAVPKAEAEKVAPANPNIREPSSAVVSPSTERAGDRPLVSYADAVARSAPAVVNVYTARIVTERVRPTSPLYDRLFGAQPPAIRQRVEASLGSGVIVDARGHVVTNHHVIAQAQQIRLQLADGREADAKVVGDDPDTDLAVLQINLKQLPVMQLGRSDRIRVGDTVLAIGNPYGLSQTVTHGIVSATGRDQLGLTPFESFIQTDAAINAGNSGGALVNAEGELVGINTAVLQQAGGAEGIGFAIPVNMVRGVLDQILEHGKVLRGWLGVGTQPVSRERANQLGLASTDGFELYEVEPNSPAARAGLLPGDVITALNNEAVRTNRDAMNRVARLKPGSKLRVQGLSERGKIDVRVTIEERK